MSKFEVAFKLVMGEDGGYANDPDDTGGETYAGISRRFHPEWPGWKRIDEVKAKCGGLLPNNFMIPDLKPQVKAFYKKNYWNKVFGDAVIDQSLVNNLFDTAVNCGHTKAAEFLQRALNVLNNREKYWNDIKVDKIIGPKTIETLNKAFSHNMAVMVGSCFSILKGSHYIDIMERKETQEKFARTWIGRVWVKE